jgi:2-polyprenyl-3-methyl-5-hydroxy-6-metoxy-1,4-benzoquinol methylase
MDVSKINYHYFETIQIGNPKQRSKEKFDLFNLPINGKTMLDIGCNTGYNSINASYDALHVTGIDNVPSVIVLAKEINDQYFHRENIDFVPTDIFKYNSGGKFDVILASSIFHYFVGKQQAFIDKCCELLEPHGGVLVLEAGISHDEVIRRADGQLCQYPSIETLLYFCKKFVLTYSCDSVKQGGDPIPRTIFHFTKR